MKKIVRVWFNHWFSTAYNIINLIKEDDDINFHVIGTSATADSVVKLTCDEWYSEPLIDDASEYIDYCTKFCEDHTIDIFVPRKNMQTISENINKFDEIKVKVLVDRDSKKFAMLNDKKESYKAFEDLSIGFIPKFHVVNCVREFSDAYEDILKDFEKVCFKFTKDEGAVSFRVIDDSIGGYDGLLKYQGSKITYKDALSALSQREWFKDLMVMPYLCGREVSVDCLRTRSGTIMIPRFKTLSRTEEIKYDGEILGICKDFYNKVGIDGPCNIQFKYHDGIPYFLEVNTRISGGIQLSCLATGINIPNIAVNQLIYIDKIWNENSVERKVSHIEIPVIL